MKSRPPLTPDQYLERAREELSEARLLLKNEYYRGACNRAYYAAFDAARGTLVALNVPVPRTHHGVNAQFYRHAVKTGTIERETGAILGRTEDIRLDADYMFGSAYRDEAHKAVDMAEEFLTTIEAKLAQLNVNQPE